VVYDRSDVLNLKPSPDIYWLAACGYCDVDEVNIFEDS
jgi:beta-phosphoglucomutase-like phosphatase (HAD superfamily)